MPKASSSGGFFAGRLKNLTDMGVNRYAEPEEQTCGWLSGCNRQLRTSPRPVCAAG